MKFEKVTTLNMSSHFLYRRNAYWHTVWKRSRGREFCLFPSRHAPVNGNFLIAGGSDTERARSICCAVRQFKHRFPDLPVIIISDSEQLEYELLRISENCLLKEMIFSNSLSPNYEPMFDLRAEQIVNLICSIARERGTMDCSELSAYTTSVLSLLSTYCDELSLSSLFEFIHTYSATELCSLAMGKLSSRESANLHNLSCANVLLHETVNYIFSLYHTCSSDACASHISLCHTISASSAVHYIHVTNSDDFSLCLSHELCSAIESGTTFLLVSALSAYSESFIHAFNKALNRPNIPVGISLSGVSASYNYFPFQVFSYRFILNTDLSLNMLKDMLEDARLCTISRKLVIESKDTEPSLPVTEDDAYAVISGASIILYGHKKKIFLVRLHMFPYFIFPRKRIISFFYTGKSLVKTFIHWLRSRFKQPSV